MKYVTDYEQALIQFARKSGTDGVICGHIHRPEIREVGGVLYLNCGDWVENCTALGEDFEGRIKLIKFHGEPAFGSGAKPLALSEALVQSAATARVE